MSSANPSTPAKRCAACGKDLTHEKRTKIPSGEYYCETCYRKQTAAITAPAPAIAATAQGEKGRGEWRMYAGLAVAIVILAAGGIKVFNWLGTPTTQRVVVSEPIGKSPSTKKKAAKAKVPEFAQKDINAKDWHGRTALNLAAAGGNHVAVEEFLALGAQINLPDTDGATPLHAAARRGHRALAEYLLSKGAELDPKAKSGNTPLGLAAEHGNQDVAEFLISKGADINSRNKSGNTPLALAKRKGHTQLAQFLREHGGKE